MLFLPQIILIVIVLIIALPFLLLAGFFHIVTIGFEKLGFPPELVLIVLLFMLVGSFINIPLGRRRIMEVQEVRFFGLIRRTKLKAQGLSINVGGGLIPIVVASFLLFRVPLQPAIIAILLMTVVSWRLARYMPGKGVTLPVLIPPLFAALFALLLAFEHAALVAFVSGVFGVLIGADLLNIPKMQKDGALIMSIGGAGVFDGIFLVGIVSALLAGL